MAKPIRLKSHAVTINAPRELVYQKMTSFGKGRLQGENNESSRVISQDGNNLVVEFRTKAGPFSYTTIEQVTLEAPERITFKHLRGPLHYAWEEFALNEADGNTELVHSGELVWSRLPLVGWLGGLLYTKPVFERTIEKHMKQIKVTCEARAARSHVFRRRQATPTD